MKKKSCLYEIESHRDSLSEKEIRIADFITADPGQAVNPSLEELADRIGVSDTTLFRFVRKIGYARYQQFRIALATETVEPRKTIYETTEETHDAESAIRVVFQENLAAMQHTLETLDRGDLDRAALLLRNATRIHLLGLGGSQIVAQDACHKFLRSGLACCAPADFHFQLMQASQARQGETALLVSHSGSNKDSLALATEIKNGGASLIVLTTRERSPLAKMADVVLLAAGAGSPYVSEAFSARIAHLTIIDVLYLRVMKYLEAQGWESLERMRLAIAPRRL